MRSRRPLWTVAVLAVLACVLAPTGATAKQPPTPARVARAQRALLGSILRGATGAQVASARLGRSPGTYRVPGTWIYLTVRARDQLRGVHAFWQGLLVAGLFRDLSARRGLPRVVGKTMTLTLPGGRRDDGGTTPLDPAGLHKVLQTPVGTIEQLLRQGAFNADVTVQSITFVRLRGTLAPQLVVVTRDPARFVESRSRKLFQLLAGVDGDGVVGRVEGTYLEVRDKAGKPVLASAYAVRVSEGLGWADPALAPFTARVPSEGRRR